MKKSRVKVPLKSMNYAIYNFIEQKCKDSGLTKSQLIQVLDGVSYDQAFLNMEVLQTGKVYGSALNMANKMLKQIEEKQQENKARE